MLGSYDRVNVTPLKKDRSQICAVHGSKRKCKKWSAYMVFDDDGEPMMSRLRSTPCKDHLADAVDEAIESNRRTRTQKEKAAKAKRIAEARKILKL